MGETEVTMIPRSAAPEIAAHADLPAAHHIKTLIDELSPIELAALEEAVCSETEADTIADNVIAAYPALMSDIWKKFIMVYGI